MSGANAQEGQGNIHVTDWQDQDALPMSRSASNATGQQQISDTTWQPVKNVVRDSANICMGERPGVQATGTVASPELAPGPGKPSMPKVRLFLELDFSPTRDLSKKAYSLCKLRTYDHNVMVLEL